MVFPRELLLGFGEWLTDWAMPAAVVTTILLCLFLTRNGGKPRR
jgi:hypothetical protein